MFTSAKEVMFLSFFVCLSVFLQLCAKTPERICMKFSGKVGSGPMNKWLNFGVDPCHHLDTRILFRICHYWYIQKVVTIECAASP